MKIGKSLLCIGLGIAGAALSVLAHYSPQRQLSDHRATLIPAKSQVSEIDQEKKRVTGWMGEGAAVNVLEKAADKPSQTFPPVEENVSDFASFVNGHRTELPTASGEPITAGTKGTTAMLTNLATEAMIYSNFERRIDQNIEELQIEKPLPRRQFKLDAANPKDSFEANVAAWNTANQLIGKASDYIGIEKGLDKNVLGRLGQIALNTWLTKGASYFSHEAAHNYLGRWKGHDNLFFSLEQLTIFGFPAVFSNGYEGPGTLDEDIFQSVSGVNQGIYNAEESFRNNLGKHSFDESISFLRDSTVTLQYAMFGSDQSTVVGGGSDDITSYVGLLNSKGINVTRKEVFDEGLIALLLSGGVYLDNVFNISWTYLAKGKREGKDPVVIKISNKELTWPLVSYYLTDQGGYYNMISILNPRGKTPLELNLGTGTDFLGSSQTDTLRLGCRYHNLKVPYLSFSPYAFFNTDRNLKPKGFSVGTEVSVPIGKIRSIFLKIEYNEGDILENTIKGEEEGLNFSGGLEVLF